MVENECLIRNIRHEFDGGRKLPWIDENVVVEAELGQQINASEELITKHKSIVGFSLKDVAKSAELVELTEIREAVCDVRRHEIDPAHDAQNR